MSIQMTSNPNNSIGAPAKKNKKRERPFLTSSQLSDLFTRLDKNGDGELDLDEFTGIIRMLRLEVNEDFIAKVFRAVDTSASGTLDLQEFICAYQKIYSGQPIDGKGANSSNEEFVRATRYGIDEIGTSIFTLYTIETIGATTTGKCYNFPIGKNNDKAADAGGKKGSHLCAIHEFFEHKALPFEGGIEALNKMIFEDSKRNETTNSRILWWVDFAASHIERSTASKFVATFGLPNNSKFMSNFGNFGNLLAKDPKSRAFVGRGVTQHNTDHVFSLSMFAQTSVLKDRPILHLLPSKMDRVLCSSDACSNPVMDWFKDYYRTRFAFLFNLSAISDTNRKELYSAYAAAAGIADRLREETTDAYDEGDDSEDGDGALEISDVYKEVSTDDKENALVKTESAGSEAVHHHHKTPNATFKHGKHDAAGSGFSIIESKGKGVPLSLFERYSTQPTWVASNTQLQSKPPSIKFDTIGLHILDQGPGANALLTVRTIDHEKHKKCSLEERSRCGIVGRIIDGLWVKLLENMTLDGVTDMAAELDDTPATLACFIMMMLHSFSMSNLGALDYWINVVENEVKDMVVSKHSAHLKEMRRIVKELCAYVDPTLQLFTEFHKEWEIESKDAASRALQLTTVKEDDEEEEEGNDEGKKPEPLPVQSAANTGNRRASQRRSILITQNNSPAMHAMVTAPPLSLIEDVEKLPLSFDIVKHFFGDNSYRDFRIMLDGYEPLDFKGLLYWRERLDRYEAKLGDVDELIASQLDEKRNFTTFSLTIITTVLAPMAILTGYFGMNFDNMTELDHTTYEYAPGITLMWILTGVVYGLMLVMSLHFRIIYSAT